MEIALSTQFIISTVVLILTLVCVIIGINSTQKNKKDMKQSVVTEGSHNTDTKFEKICDGELIYCNSMGDLNNNGE